MNSFISIEEMQLSQVRGGSTTYARDYGRFLGGYVGATVNRGYLTGIPMIGGIIAFGFGVWAAFEA